MLDIKALILKMLVRTPQYKTIINGASFSTTTANTWQYIGKSFTVPTGHIYVARLHQNYANGRPLGLGVHSSSSLTSAANFPAHNAENSAGINYYTMLLTAGTYYVFTKRSATGNNTYTLTALDFNIS